MKSQNKAKPEAFDDALRERLALRPKEAATLLGIGQRLLWSKTNSGEIPHMRIGRRLLYPVHLLLRWLDEQAQKGSPR